MASRLGTAGWCTLQSEIVPPRKARAGGIGMSRLPVTLWKSVMAITKKGGGKIGV
jgi:hypothetical protein